MLRVLQDNGWAGKVHFVGFDASENLVKGLASGQIDALVVQDLRGHATTLADSPFVAQFRASVFGRFFRQFGDRQEAEDLAQEVFLRLFRSRRRYQPRARFATWLFHVAANVGRNAVRRRQR